MTANYKILAAAFLLVGLVESLSTTSWADTINPLYLSEFENCGSKDSDGVEKPELRQACVIRTLAKKYPISFSDDADYELNQSELLSKSVAGCDIRELTKNVRSYNEALQESLKKGEISKEDFQEKYITFGRMPAERNLIACKNDEGAKAEIKERLLDPLFRFSKSSTEYQMRQTLLRMFEAGYSGGANGYVVIPNLENIRSVLPIGAESYRPLKSHSADDRVLAAYLAGIPVFEVVLRAKVKAAEKSMLSKAPDEKLYKDRSLPQVQTFTNIASAITKEYKFGKKIPERETYFNRTQDTVKSVSLQAHLYKDMDQFVADKPEGASASIPFDYDEQDDDPNFTVNAAFGVSVKTPLYHMMPWLDDDRPNVFSDRTWMFQATPFLSFQQTPVKREFVDTADLFNDDGSLKVQNGELSLANVLYGFQFAFIEDDVCSDTCKYGKNGTEEKVNDRYRGVTAPGHEVVLTIAGVTDNYTDQLGFFASLGWKPGLGGHVPFYRKFNGRRGPFSGDEFGIDELIGSIQYKVDLNVLALEYQDWTRAPQDYETWQVNDRLTDKEKLRYGADLDATMSLPNVFATPGETSRFSLSGSYKFREPFGPGDSIELWTLGLTLNDVINEHVSIGIDLKKGEDLINEGSIETLELKFGSKF